MMPHRRYYRSYFGRHAPFIADPKSLDRTHGRQIDWAHVASSYIDPTWGKKVLPAGSVVGEALGAGKISPQGRHHQPRDRHP